MLVSKGSASMGAIISMLILTLLFNPFCLLLAQTQDKCEKELTDAEQKYYAGRFDEAIEQARRCLSNTGLSDAEQLRAYKLMSLAFIAKDYLEQAKSAVQRLLELVPTYEPDPDQDPPPFTNMVKEVKETIEQQKKKEEQAKRAAAPPEPAKQAPPAKKGGSKTLLLIGGGVVAGLVAVLVAGGGGGGDGSGVPTPQILPDPPPPPRPR